MATMKNNTSKYTNGSKNGSSKFTISRRIGGQKVSINSTSEKFSILSATKKLASNGVTNFIGSEIGAETNNLLEALSCTVLVSPGADYSLLNAQTDTEVIENPNIASDASSSRQNMTVSTDTSFPNADDPFYEADITYTDTDDTNLAIKKQLDAGEKASPLAADISLMNLSTDVESTLAAFQSTENNSYSTKMKSVSYK